MKETASRRAERRAVRSRPPRPAAADGNGAGGVSRADLELPDGRYLLVYSSRKTDHAHRGPSADGPAKPTNDA
jgi:hypothetical protein